MIDSKILETPVSKMIAAQQKYELPTEAIYDMMHIILQSIHYMAEVEKKSGLTIDELFQSKLTIDDIGHMLSLGYSPKTIYHTNKVRFDYT